MSDYLSTFHGSISSATLTRHLDIGHPFIPNLSRVIKLGDLNAVKAHIFESGNSLVVKIY